ncbi:HpcH/HpaI aldolase/citrate lyase family protein [Arthrobacter crystallopoietes]|jgi:citrate lyase subunit beta / citryl-CoA lyase|uniref:Citrate lyase subunit beta / citryl-CoA lyase n=1 Tax=Crystallibacter crystallopoietes TaxID=37928 RepID=A0A1H1H4U3_9MICC|nr:CoA ester lyase [Arthrobacter crystallopoietes]AUI52158.1 CoA ester lyase [Arthrobacter crystallopoietes]SDR20383.1 citrate lyase subunit beta / citryl-CoA lyase [Arthrobacter crystallopoietes]
MFTMGPAILFCPADRPERYAKAADRADAVILDLEDAVAPADRASARQAVIDNPLDPERTIVRVNPLGTEDHALDMAALQRTGYATIMLAKSENADAIAGLGGYGVVALCETALGVLAAPDIARTGNVVALMWGAEDLLASLGGTSSRNAGGTYRDVARQARSQVLLAAGAYGKTAIDSVYVDIPDLDGLAAEAEDAVACGFGAKAVIHPSQIPVIRAAYLPSEAAVADAAALLEAARTEPGVFRFRGKMVDGPLIKHAEQTLRRAGLAG